MSDEKEKQEFTIQLGLEYIWDNVVYIFLCVCWLAGFIIAKGFWSTLFAIIPFWAWYLVLEKFMIAQGWV